MSQSLLANELGPGKTLVQQRSWLRRSVLVPATNEQRRLENGDVPRSVPPVPVQCFDVHQEAVQTNAATLCDELHVWQGAAATATFVRLPSFERMKWLDEEEWEQLSRD